jgi:thioredoxin 1
MPLYNVNEESFAKIKESGKKALIDFYADWCGPCKMLAPILHEISEENPDLIIAKINVDDSTSLAIQYGIQSIPTMLVMENGEIVNKAVGLRSKEQILDMLK